MFAHAFGQSPATQPNAVDQATVDRAMQRLRERQAATSSGGTNADPARPADVDEDTWRELKIYLGREQSPVAWDIKNTAKATAEAKRLLVILRAERSPSADNLQRITDTVAEVERNEKRLSDLRAGLPVPNFHGAELDLEHVRLHQIGYIGTGGRGEVRLIYASDGRSAGDRSLVQLEWQRYRDRTTKYDGGRVTATDTVNAKTVYVTLHDPDFFAGRNNVPRWESGAPVSNDHAYQVTKAENGSVELTLIDLSKLKTRWVEAQGKAVSPTPTSDGSASPR